MSKSRQSTNDLQFSLRSMMIITTVACIVLAFPLGYLILLAVGIWMFIGLAVGWILLLLRKPICRIVAGKKYRVVDR